VPNSYVDPKDKPEPRKKPGKKGDHASARHDYRGDVNPKSDTASKFSSTTDIDEVIERSKEFPGVVSEDGNSIITTFDMGRTVGWDQASQEFTSTVTMITDTNGYIRTVHPGTPSRGGLPLPKIAP